MSLTEDATLRIMQTLLTRPDAMLYTPDDLANKAFEYVEAIGRRVHKHEMERMSSTQAAMKNMAVMPVLRPSPNAIDIERMMDDYKHRYSVDLRRP